MTERASGRLLLVLLAAAGFAACAPNAVVILSAGYDPSRVKSVSMTSFADFPGAPGSGDAAANTFEKYLLSAGYRVLGPDQVDALAIGALTDYTGAQDQTVMVDIPQTQSDPVYGQVTTTVEKTSARTGRGGGGEMSSVERSRTRDVVIGYNTTQTNQVVPETVTVPAHVALNVRLLDAKTNELLWSVSAAASGDDLPSATEAASANAMQAVVKKLRKLE